MATLGVAIADLSVIRALAVTELREQGWTYRRIGELLGVTRKRARDIHHGL